MPFFKPILAGAGLTDRLVACLGAAIGIVLTILVCARWPLAPAGLPMIVAPIGASAVLVFAVPASPLAQPWPVIGGNAVSALVGAACWRWIPDATIAAGVAVGAAILAMSLLRCLHPPGGAVALIAVIGGPAVHAAGLGFALAPVAVDSIALVAAALVFHRLGPHRYPHRAVAAAGSPFHGEDIDRALADMHESFDIAREDLEALLAHAERHAVARRGGTGRQKKKVDRGSSPG